MKDIHIGSWHYTHPNICPSQDNYFIKSTFAIYLVAPDKNGN